MSKRFPASIVAGLAMAAVWSLASGPVLGQADVPRATNLSPASTPRTADGKVDFSGIWSPDRKFIYDINDALKPVDTLPLQPWAAKMVRERMSKDDPEANCLPAGVPRQAPYPWRIVQ